MLIYQFTSKAPVCKKDKSSIVSDMR